MAHEDSKVSGFAVDNAAASLIDISGSCNAVTWTGAMEMLDDTGLGDSDHTVVAGLGNAKTVSVNGMLNSTTRAIFAPLAAASTSITKTIEVKLATGDYWTGEAWPDNVTIGLPLGLNTFSCNFSAQSGLSSTSVSAAS